MRNAVVIAFAAALLLPSGAVANSQTQSSPRWDGIVSYADVRRATVKHDGRNLIHTVQTYGRFARTQLTNQVFSASDLGVFVEIAVRAPEPYFIGGGKYQLMAVYRDGRLRGILRNNAANRERSVKVTHPDAKTLRWTISKKSIGSPRRYWWAAVTSVPSEASSGTSDFTNWLSHRLR